MAHYPVRPDAVGARKHQESRRFHSGLAAEVRKSPQPGELYEQGIGYLVKRLSVMIGWSVSRALRAGEKGAA
jgi:hypothetical protein